MNSMEWKDRLRFDEDEITQIQKLVRDLIPVLFRLQKEIKDRKLESLTNKFVGDLELRLEKFSDAVEENKHKRREEQW